MLELRSVAKATTPLNKTGTLGCKISDCIALLLERENLQRIDGSGLHTTAHTQYEEDDAYDDTGKGSKKGRKSRATAAAAAGRKGGKGGGKDARLLRDLISATAKQSFATTGAIYCF